MSKLKVQNQWWLDNVTRREGEFYGWLGGDNDPSRVAVKNHILDEKYSTMLDCACGGCAGYIDGIDYTGIDSTPYLVNRAKNKG